MLSLAITTFNRLEFTLNSFAEIYDDERIDEIVISDDCSDMDCYKAMLEYTKNLPKIRLHRNVSNQGCYINKYIATSLCKNDFVIIFDSDNVLTKDYLNAIEKYYPLSENTIYAPDFLMPTFNYNHFAGQIINNSNVSYYTEMKLFDCLINSCNYVVPRKNFCNTFDLTTKKYADDTAYINLVWLQHGGEIFVVPDMQYYHTIHDKSHYQQYAVESKQRFDDIMQQFKNMK